MAAQKETALVTGSSRGLGRGIAVELARKGFNVAVHYAGAQDKALETVRLCQEAASDANQKFTAFAADISNPADRMRLLNETIGAFGSLEILVNNAGIAPQTRADLLEMEEASFDRLFDVNLKGPFFLTQSLARLWQAQGPDERRRVFFCTSVSANMASLNRGEYCMSKAALGMAASLFALRLADLGAKVFEVRPGIMRSDMTAGVQEKYDALIAGGLVPQKRWGDGQDVGRCIAGLLEGGGFATGSVVYVDGGLHLPVL